MPIQFFASSRFLLRALIALTVAGTLSSCGSSGGSDDGDFIGAAIVNMQVSPGTIDTGDRAEVNIEISELHKNGISLKVRFPAGLVYVPSSSFIEVNSDEIDVSPTVNQESDSDVYLVYYINKDQIGENDTGTLFFQLEGKDPVEDGKIQVDPDVDDPDIDNASEFDIDAPEFGAEDEVTIVVTE